MCTPDDCTFSDKQNSLAAYEKPCAYREKLPPAFIDAAIDGSASSRTLQLFMLHYSAFGISMTHPVDGSAVQAKDVMTLDMAHWARR